MNCFKMAKKDKKKKCIKNDPSVFRYSVNLNSVENAKFQSMFLKSGQKNLSRFILSMIFGREMKLVVIDKAGRDFYMRLTNIYAQYKAVGVNYNQTVKAIKTNFSEKRAVVLLRKLNDDTNKLISITNEVLTLAREFEDIYIKGKRR